MAKKYLLFDIDGTLVNTGGAGLRAMKAAFEAHLGADALEGNYSFAGKTDTHIIHDMLRRAGVTEDTGAELALRVKADYLANLETALLQSQAFMVYPDVRELIDACSRCKDMELALLTGNYREGAHLKLEHAGLWDYFRWGVFGDISENRIHLAEEARAILAARDDPFPDEDIVIIGDTISDVRCGRAIGATTVAFVGGFGKEEDLRAEQPTFVITSFRECFRLWGL
ncbi:MAG: HAD family hydrolase [Deltaproteobacteria bacterium]|nr:HAD family hydrolase [Deltaproteobacteria bacterium]